MLRTFATRCAQPCAACLLWQVVLFLSALVAGTVVRRARSTYLEGVLLLAAYAIVAMTYLQKSHDEQLIGTWAFCECGKKCCR